MSFLDFVNKKTLLEESSQWMNEAFKEKDYNKAKKTILNILKKEITIGHVWSLGVSDLKVDGNDCSSVMYIVSDKDGSIPKSSFSINFLKSGQSMVPYSVAFFNQANTASLFFVDSSTPIKAQLEIKMMGASIVYYIPVIANVINNGKFDISSEEAVKLGRKVYDTKNECISWDMYFGAQKYHIYEGISEDKVIEKYHLNLGHKYKKIGESYQWINETELEDRKKEVYAQMKTNTDPDLGKALYKEYRQILNAIKGGATSLEDLECSVKKNVSVTPSFTGVAKAEKKIETAKSDPKTAFKEMQMYVKMVIKGIQPAVILCGAPGIGKTFRVKQQLKAAGYTMTADNTVKGKCTPRQLYLTLYNNKGKGDIVLVDDADSLVGPKAPEDCINILKAALDSTADDEGRLVSYKVSGELKDDEGEPVPKSHYNKCGMIVITNYSVGQIDTALRNRAFTQSLDFSTKDLLQIIRDIMPNIESNRLSMTSKAKAMNYLEKLVEEGKPIEVSCRSFITCARIYENSEEDDDLGLAEKMIAEQMRNQSLRGGRKF
nr:MAG TPA: AAA domain protein [Ackermannviridae sp.]